MHSSDSKAFSNAVALIRLVRKVHPNLSMSEAIDIALGELPVTQEEKVLSRSDSKFKKRKK